MDWNENLKTMFESFKLGFQGNSDNLAQNANHAATQDNSGDLIAAYTAPVVPPPVTPPPSAK